MIVMTRDFRWSFWFDFLQQVRVLVHRLYLMIWVMIWSMLWSWRCCLKVILLRKLNLQGRLRIFSAVSSTRSYRWSWPFLIDKLILLHLTLPLLIGLIRLSIWVINDRDILFRCLENFLRILFLIWWQLVIFLLILLNRLKFIHFHRLKIWVQGLVLYCLSIRQLKSKLL